MIENRDIWDQIEESSPPDSLEEEMFHLISAYADGECSRGERRLVEAYFNESPAARRLLAELRAQGTLFSATTEDPPAWLGPSILARTIYRRRAPYVTLAFAGLAAACIFAAVISRWVNVGEQQKEEAKRMEMTPPVADFGAGRSVDFAKGDAAQVVASVGTPRRPPAKALAGLGTVGPSLRGGESAASAVRLGGGGGPSGSAAAPPGVVDAQTHGPDYGVATRAAPEQPDVVSMASQSIGDEQEATHESAVASSGSGQDGPDPREALRQRLRKLNESRSGLKEALRGTG